MKRILCLALSAILFAACAKDKPVIVPPPAELSQCADEPAAPSLPRVDWSSVETARPTQNERDLTTLDYILSLRSAWGDCRAKVDGLAAWRDETDR